MEKYYYYCYRGDNGFGCCIGKYEGEFDIYSATAYVKLMRNLKDVVITNWQEISSQQFKKLSSCYAKSQK